MPPIKPLCMGRADRARRTIGSPTFHQLHWEALREPGRDPFVLYGPMVRRTQTALQQPMAIQASPMIRLLVVIARPRGRRDVGYCTSSRPLIDRLRQVQAPVQVDLVRPETYPALVEPLTTQRAASRHRRLPPGARRPARSRPDVPRLGPGGWDEPPDVPRPPDGQPFKALESVQLQRDINRIQLSILLIS
jgi:hypothetical protein